MNAATILWFAGITAIEVIFTFCLFSKRLEKRNLLGAVIGALIVFLVIFILKFFSVDNMIVVCVSAALYFCYAFFGFCSGVAARLLLGCLPTILMLTAHVLTAGVSMLLYNNSGVQDSIQVFVNIVYLMFLSVFYFIAIKIGGKSQLRLSTQQAILLLCLTLLCSVAISTQLKIIQTAQSQSIWQEALFVCGVVLILVVAIMFLFQALGRETQKGIERSLEAEKADMESEYHKNNEISMTALKELRHDIKTHLHVMKSLMEQGKTEELQDYFVTIEEKYRRDSLLFLTEDTMLNAMLASKQLIAQSYKIPMDVSYNTKNSIPLSPTDLCSLVGNMLDNAIEANRGLREQLRNISITVGDKDDMVYVKVQNSADGNYKYENGEIVTTKAGGKNGIGLKHINKIAEQAHGFFHINPRPDSFTAVVMLPVERE